MGRGEARGHEKQKEVEAEFSIQSDRALRRSRTVHRAGGAMMEQPTLLLAGKPLNPEVQPEIPQGYQGHRRCSRSAVDIEFSNLTYTVRRGQSETLRREHLDLTWRFECSLCVENFNACKNSV